jgi:choline kinase
MRYVILAKGGHEGFDIPRQLSVINGERILDRTIRLLKENGIGSKDIIVTGNYKDLGDVIVYDPLDNDFDYNTESGYWLNAFSNEFLIEPVCFIWGDVYFSENAIKTIVNTDTDSTLFFCSYQNKSHRYIKEWDEPFAYKVVDTNLFRTHRDRVERLFDEGKTDRHPIVWELYRSINGIDVNKHELNDNVVIINDITCDIDTPEDIKKIEERIGNMVRAEVTTEVDVGRFNEITEVIRRNAQNDTNGHLFVGDIVLCNDDIAEYLNGNNKNKTSYVKIIEVIPEVKEEKKTKRGRKSAK